MAADKQLLCLHRDLIDRRQQPLVRFPLPCYTEQDDLSVHDETNTHKALLNAASLHPFTPLLCVLAYAKWKLKLAMTSS